MWPADIGRYDGWRAGGCGWLSPPIHIYWIIWPLMDGCKNGKGQRMWGWLWYAVHGRATGIK